MVSIAVHGDLAGRAPVLRSGARPGDVVAHAGVRGRSAAGLALLAAGRRDAVPELVEAYLRPVSPLAAGPAAAAAGATAMLDVSDGLLRDAGRLARASGVVLDLDPVRDAFGDDVDASGAAGALLGVDPQTWVLAVVRTTACSRRFRPVGRPRRRSGWSGRVVATRSGRAGCAGGRPGADDVPGMGPLRT